MFAAFLQLAIDELTSNGVTIMEQIWFDERSLCVILFVLRILRSLFPEEYIKTTSTEFLFPILFDALEDKDLNTCSL